MPFEEGSRCHPNPPYPPGAPRVKQFPVDGNFKTRIAGQLREEAGPCPGHIFLSLAVRKPP